ncbi:MAG: carbamoyl phosphate synthase small subunit [bacterium]
MTRPALLALADGTIFRGESVGVDGEAVGEVVFNTAITGYQEILTDPSYARQLVTLTYPHIGNVGACANDRESRRVFCAGLIVRDVPRRHSNWRAHRSLPDYLADHGVVAISGIDTRQLTRLIRMRGAQSGCIVAGASPDAARALAVARAFPGIGGMDLAREVSVEQPYSWHEGCWIAPGANDGANDDGDDGTRDTNGDGDTRGIDGDGTHARNAVGVRKNGDAFGTNTVGMRKNDDDNDDSHVHDGYAQAPTPQYKVVACDYGVKHNILRMLAARGCALTVVPARTGADDILALQPDGVFLSNGPGDPQPCDYAIDAIGELIARRIPLFGICLGHQLLALAGGARTEKMKFGHHGANHPVRDVDSGRVLITSQNHGFAVQESSLPARLRITHRSLFDGSIQGLALRDAPAFSFQGHPEASPGPHDIGHLFDRFIALLDAARERP